MLGSRVHTTFWLPVVPTSRERVPRLEWTAIPSAFEVALFSQLPSAVLEWRVLLYKHHVIRNTSLYQVWASNGIHNQRNVTILIWFVILKMVFAMLLFTWHSNWTLEWIWNFAPSTGSGRGTEGVCETHFFLTPARTSIPYDIGGGEGSVAAIPNRQDDATNAKDIQQSNDTMQ